MREQHFISGAFFDCPIPDDKLFLLPYFKSDLYLTFLRYYLLKGGKDLYHFCDHTGYPCSDNLLYRLRDRVEGLTRVYEEAKASLTEEGMALLYEIESGKFKLKNLPRGNK